MKIIKMPGKQMQVKVHSAHIPVVTAPRDYAKLPTRISAKGLPSLSARAPSVKAVGMKVAVPPTGVNPLPTTSPMLSMPTIPTIVKPKPLRKF